VFHATQKVTYMSRYHVVANGQPNLINFFDISQDLMVRNFIMCFMEVFSQHVCAIVFFTSPL